MRGEKMAVAVRCCNYCAVLNNSRQGSVVDFGVHGDANVGERHQLLLRTPALIS